MWNSINRISLSRKKRTVQKTNAKPGLSCSRKDAEKNLLKLIPPQDTEYFFWVVRTGFIFFCNTNKPTYIKNTFNIIIGYGFFTRTALLLIWREGYMILTLFINVYGIPRLLLPTNAQASLNGYLKLSCNYQLSYSKLEKLRLFQAWHQPSAKHL